MNDTKLNLTEEQISAITKTLEDANPEVYFDYNDKLSNEDKIRIFEGKINDVIIDLSDLNNDHIYDIEIETIKDALKTNNLNPDDYEIQDLRDYFLYCFHVNIPVENLIDSIPVKISVVSNYDCMNSHWSTNQEGYSYQNHYFKDFIDALNLNPKKVKETLQDRFKLRGKWPDKPNRNGKEYIAYEDLIEELENSCGGANLLTFIGMLDLNDCIKGEPEVIIIPKGNTCGLFDNFNGSGSLIGMKLLRDMKINLSKTFKDGYGGFSLDHCLDDKYGIQSVYGVSDSFFGKEITVLENKII